MPTLDELQRDQHFLSATPADQIKYLSDTDPSFKAARPDDQAAFLAHVTKQPTGAEPYAPAKTAEEALGVAGDFWNKQGAVAPGDKGADAPGSAIYIAQQVAKNLVGEPRSGASVGEQTATAMMQPSKKAAEVAGRLATGALGIATQFYHAFADKPKDEEEQAAENTGIPGVGESSLTGRLGGRLALAGKRLVIDPSMSVYGHTLGQEATDKAAGQEHGAMEKAASRVGNIPVIGPFLISEGERAGTGDILGAAGDIAAMEASGKVAKEVPKEFPTVNAAIRTGAKVYEAGHRNLPALGAAIGGIAGTVEHGPAGAAIGTLAGERGGRVIQKITPDATKLTTHGLTQAEKDIKFHEAATKVADKAKAKADEDVAHYAASESAGPLNETDNPAYKKAKDAQAKAATAQAEAHFHLQEAREAARVAGLPSREITPGEVAAARPEAPMRAPEEPKVPLGGKTEVPKPEETKPVEAPKPAEETKPETKPVGEPLAEENRRALEHRIGKTNMDLLDTPQGLEAARRIIRGTNKQFSDMANYLGLKGGSGEAGAWLPEDFGRSRAEHGGELSPKKEAVINELRKQFPDHIDLMEATKHWGPNVESFGAPAGGVDNTHEAAVKEGGGEYKGVQEGVPEAGLKGLVLFDHPETHSSLALPEDEVTHEAVKAKLEAHKEAWDKAKGEPKGVHKPGEAESDVEMERRGVGVPEAVKAKLEEHKTATSFNPKELESGENKPVGHTYEFKDSGTLKHVDAKDADGNVVATVVAIPEEKDPNTWTVGFSGSTTDTKGVGLDAYAKLADAAKAEAERTGKPVVLQGDKQMTAAARRTWVKLGEQRGYDVQWDKNNRPRITFRSSEMKPLGKASSKKIVE